LVLFFNGQFANSVPLEYLYNTCKYLEMSYEFNSDTNYWPTSDPFKKQTVFKGKTNGGFYYEAFKFCAAEHGGTHLDAPAHFNEHGPSVEQISLQQFVAEAFVINIKDQVKNNRDYAMTVDDILNYESKYGQIEDQAILIVNTGYGVHWPIKKDYMGSDVPNDTTNLHFPGVSAAAAAWLVANRTIAVLGIDTASMDPGPSKDFPVHQILLGHNISGFENLRNVDSLPPRGATIIALPMSITGGSGAPLRAFAVGWDGANDPCRYSASAGSIVGRLTVTQYGFWFGILICIMHYYF